MARQLRDTSPVVADILDGKHDDVLNHITRAADWRMKQRMAQSGLRPGSRIKITEAANPEFVGRTGRVDRVNPKTISVELDPLDEHDYRVAWRFPHSWVEPA